jgi:transcription elongation factor S-II
VKRIIKKWKEEVSHQKAAKHKGSDKAATASTANGATKPEGGAGVIFDSHGKPRNAKNDGVRTDIYSDKVRNSSLDVTYTALAIGSDVTASEILAVAKTVEETVFNGEKGTTPGYRNKMRSLYLNLKDPKNPMLRKRVVGGEITPDRLYKMTPQEMASDELKKEIEELEKKNLFKAEGATPKNAVTDQFTCSKCKQKKVSYYQMQTRSADEPLTTFCTCENCGHRWKFS